MDSTDLKDKLVLDPLDSPDLAEFFSRKDPGDTVTFQNVVVTLDEAGEKVICLSLKSFDIEQGDDEEPIHGKARGDEGETGEDADKPEGEGEGGPSSAAVEVFKDDDGVPAQKNNIPTDYQPAR